MVGNRGDNRGYCSGSSGYHAYLQWDATRRQSRVSVLRHQLDCYLQLSRTIGGLSIVVTNNDEREILAACDVAILVFDPKSETDLTKLMQFTRNANIARANRQSQYANQGPSDKEYSDNEALRALWQSLKPMLRSEIREWRKTNHPLSWLDDVLDWIEGRP